MSTATSENQCTGCGATVTNQSHGIFRGVTGSQYCQRKTSEEALRFHSIELPPVAIKTLVSRKPHRDFAGYVCELRNRYSGGHTIILDCKRAAEQGQPLVEDYKAEGGRYQVLCNEHGHIVYCTNLPLARSVMKDPTEFCMICRVLAGQCSVEDAGLSDDDKEAIKKKMPPVAIKPDYGSALDENNVCPACFREYGEDEIKFCTADDCPSHPDYRVAIKPEVAPEKMIGKEAMGNGNEHFGIHDANNFCSQRGCKPEATLSPLEKEMLHALNAVYSGVPDKLRDAVAADVSSIRNRAIALIPVLPETLRLIQSVIAKAEAVGA